MVKLLDKIKMLSEQYHEDNVSIRRHLHAHPELSYQEKSTAAFIQDKLKEYGIPFQANIAGHGISAFILGKNPQQSLRALRADMDALPISELNEVSYKSKNDGVMHACGHDVHTTCLLGAARILASIREELEGTIQLIFQPAEEVLPGGASLMIKDGVFDNRVPSAIFGQHVYPELPVGKIGVKPGVYMASTDELYIKIKGVGGHGAKPDRNIDAVLISAHLIVALQQVVSRWSNPATPSVLSIGKVIANGATNIIPGEVILEGTFRTFDESWRKEAHTKMKALAEGLVAGMGGEVDFRIEVGYPVLKNDEDLTAKSRELLIAYLGAENVVPLDVRMTAEDFAYYSQMMPACFYRLGTSSPKDDSKSFSVHHPRFDVDEESLKIGSGILAWLAVNH